MAYFSSGQKLRLARSLVSKRSPAYVQFYITARCNLTCEQCNIIYADAPAEEMNLTQIRRMAENLAEIGVCIVLLIGGEPFVRRDIAEIVQVFTDVGIHVRLQTNGLARRSVLEACVKNGAHDISISLDSLQPALQETINGGFPRSWDRAIETIAMVNELFPENGTAFFNSVIMPRNLKDIPDVIAFASRIGWGVSLVPVHTSDPERPRDYCTFDDTDVVRFTPEFHADLRALIDRLKAMKRDGYPLYDSDEYLDDIYRFVAGEPLRWRRRNLGVCDSPDLYFAVAPDGHLKVCCDFELDAAFPVYDPGFPTWYRDGLVREEVYKTTRACDGCMYGSYPEITISARSLRSMLNRFLYFNVRPPRLQKLQASEMLGLAREIIARP